MRFPFLFGVVDGLSAQNRPARQASLPNFPRLLARIVTRSWAYVLRLVYVLNP